MGKNWAHRVHHDHYPHRGHPADLRQLAILAQQLSGHAPRPNRMDTLFQVVTVVSLTASALATLAHVFQLHRYFRHHDQERHGHDSHGRG